MVKQKYTMTCDYILVDFDKATRTGRNRYRLTLMTALDKHPDVNGLTGLTALRKVFAPCDYNLISHSNDGEVLTGPFVVNFTLDGRKRAVLTEFHKF